MLGQGLCCHPLSSRRREATETELSADGYFACLNVNRDGVATRGVARNFNAFSSLTLCDGCVIGIALALPLINRLLYRHSNVCNCSLIIAGEISCHLLGISGADVSQVSCLTALLKLACENRDCDSSQHGRHNAVSLCGCEFRIMLHICRYRPNLSPRPPLYILRYNTFLFVIIIAHIFIISA